MRIRIVVPGCAETLSGNWRTARRWAELLRAAGHAVQLTHDASDDSGDHETDVLVALHARRSHPVIVDSRARWPSRDVVVALTGTDVYHDLGHDDSGEVHRSLELASAIVVLQEQAATELPERFRARTRVIYQSAQPFTGDPERGEPHFRVLVVANLRPEKDALRPALAARALPAESRVEVVLVGAPLDPESEHAAREEADDNPRFEWRGYRPYTETRALIAGSNLVVIPSRIEGSSNVLSEALVDGVPVLAARIPGLVGTLGDAYPGYFPAGDTAALCALMERAEADAGFLGELVREGKRVRVRLDPAAESAAWARLLAELTPPAQ